MLSVRNLAVDVQGSRVLRGVEKRQIVIVPAETPSAR